ncbi:MAG: zeta toxin family protein [Desulfomicrobiaceae bacterium]|nr:zeta toxin family protein [Desulfomicrobiaceae bacterium]
MNANHAKTLCIIAGPNGAGKTTFALEYLSKEVGFVRFINVDLIAAGLSPLAPERALSAASRIFLGQIEACIAKGESFAFETTLSGRTYLRLIDRLHQDGWRIELIYLALPNIEMSKMRVAERVAHGGHNVPSVDIERRFPRSLRNLLDEFSHRVDICTCFMNHGERPVLVFEQYGIYRKIVHNDYYRLLLEEARR